MKNTITYSKRLDDIGVMSKTGIRDAKQVMRKLELAKGSVNIELLTPTYTVTFVTTKGLALLQEAIKVEIENAEKWRD